MTHILFLIRDLESGGAQRQLITLVNGLDKTRFQVTLVTFYVGGSLAHEVAAEPGVTLRSLHKQGRWDNLAALLRLWRLVRQVQPDILHGYLNIANLFTLLVGKATGRRVVWGLRNTIQGLTWTEKVAFRLCARLSRLPHAIIVNSQAGMHYHTAEGYSPHRMAVIPNGINTARFRPDATAGAAMRTAWGVAPETLLIGKVSRLEPLKDHATFFAAAALLAQQRADVQFICIGSGTPEYTLKLRQQVAQLGIAAHVRWVDGCDDMPAVYNSLDIATLASVSEGFPNVVGEAMACGVPCVVTDVGDAALIVGETGVVVPPGNARALAAGWLMALATDTPMQRAQQWQRIVQHFSMQRMVQHTESVLGALR
jgi:glycosyltransferase involved in cell wall biosynthesis